MGGAQSLFNVSFLLRLSVVALLIINVMLVQGLINVIENCVRSLLLFLFLFFS